MTNFIEVIFYPYNKKKIESFSEMADAFESAAKVCRDWGTLKLQNDHARFQIGNKFVGSWTLNNVQNDT